MVSESIIAENYESFARQIARIEWAVCDDEISGSRIVNHVGNDHYPLCDMLARLGVMYATAPIYWHQHHFPVGWSPFEDIALSRHSGEPTANDLWLGLTFPIHWFPDDANIAHRGQAVSVDADFGDLARVTPAKDRYRAWAVQGACELLCSLGLGTWKADGQFQILDPASTIDSIEAYWLSQNEAAERLGGRDRLYPGPVVRAL